MEDSGKYSTTSTTKKTPRFQIDIDKVILVAKNFRGVDLAVEFEVKH